MRIPKKAVLTAATLCSCLLLSNPVYADQISINQYGQDASGYVDSGPGAVKKEKEGVQGESLGTFTITGYCNCSQCSGGHNLTYSGTVPQANHTISADLNMFPLGTKLMINQVIYTVEDMGSGVNGRTLDIFFATHEEALDWGSRDAEVFRVVTE